MCHLCDFKCSQDSLVQSTTDLERLLVIIFTELVQLGRLHIFIVQRKRLLRPMFSLMDAKNYKINYLNAGDERVTLFSSVLEENDRSITQPSTKKIG